MTNRKSVLALAALALNAVAAQPGGWTDAVEVRHDDDLCISYQAKVPIMTFAAARDLEQPFCSGAFA